MSAFSALPRTPGFRSLGLPTPSRDAAARLQPLLVRRTAAAPEGAAHPRGTDGTSPADQSEPAQPAPPSREDLEAAERALARAEGALATAQAEVRRLHARLEEEQRSARAVADGFERGLAEARQELRVSYARLVMQGARRLVGALERHEPVFLARLDEVAEQLVLESDVVIRVAPRNQAAAEAAVFGRAGWLVEIDPTMDGGCVAQCRNATVDARMDTAFAALDRALEAWVCDDGHASTARGC